MHVGEGSHNPNIGYTGGNLYKPPDVVHLVFTTESDDKQSQRRRYMEVNATMPAVQQYMCGSEQPHDWSRNDHPKVMPNPGGYALVVDPTLYGPGLNIKFTKVLIDNGSSINILYWNSALKMGITPNMLQPSRTTFHGIVPGVSCAPMGKIRLDAMFGTRKNCRTESLEFEVVDLPSPYHALFGRPALAQFMASTHVGYLKMKMPGPNGTITVAGDYRVSMQCASVGSALAESMVIAEEAKKMQFAVSMAQKAVLGMPVTGGFQDAPTFKPTQETKQVQVDPAYPERTVTIGAGLSDK